MVCITLETDLQKDLLKENKSDMELYLRKKLNNCSISIEVEVNESGDNTNRLYTDDDKFKHMSEKNPNLLKLKQRLNLDFL